ncbi:S-layer homology domain-containing protein [Paenibacillus silviterrae]|uniref:S-layer homology domain-containing protein n=1 Tax=Paenibacillus silviterrae TaxID=3242194 RepID=UPI002543879D|nr:S-layer homology domain-containing protein [Paenibacillus chinjuensis]
MKKRYSLTVAMALLLSSLSVNGYVSADVRFDGETERKLRRVGTWDETTMKREVPMPYVNAAEQEVDFGKRSFYHAPWKSYMDTWDARKYFETLGVNFNVAHEEAEAVAKLLAEAGIRSARVEIGWDNLDYDDDTKLKPRSHEHIGKVLRALANHGIRPMILLNANSGMPSPSRITQARLVRDAKAGDRHLYLEQVSGIKLNYTGLHAVHYQTMYPIITAVESATGKVTLSAPLANDLKAGPIELSTLKYLPFSEPSYSDGTPNPASAETVRGWTQYITTVTRFVKDNLQSDGQADAGFDLEVWNEYTFGSEFLSLNNYYEPDLPLTGKIQYTGGGKTVLGHELILPLTADFVSKPENRLPGVRVLSGFSNQRPWDNGTDMWPTQHGISRHYYTGFKPGESYIAEGHTDSTKVYLNALGGRDGQEVPGNPDQTVPGSYYVPPHEAGFPEMRFYAYETEFVTRDVQPFPGSMPLHHRYASPGGGKTGKLWMTETNFHRRPIADDLASKLGTHVDDPRLVSLMQHMGAKSTLRNYLFYGHKGLETIDLYAVKSEIGFSMIPDSFFQKLAQSQYQLTPEVRGLAGPQLTSLTNLSALMRTGRPVATPRPLKVEGITEYEPRLVYEGDGTPEHPSRYHGDDLAILPYQLDEGRFAIGYYVVTRNLAHVWDSSKQLWDPARYQMPDQTFDITLSNVRGSGSNVYAYDPVQGTRMPVTVVESTYNQVKVRLQVTDYPRMLMIEENEPGPVLGSPTAERSAGGAVLRFTPNLSGTVQIETGKYPTRSNGTFNEQRYALEDDSYQTPLYTKQVAVIDYVKGTGKTLPAERGRWRWTGTIRPEYSETYTFQIRSDNEEDIQLQIGGETVIAPKSGKLKAIVELKAGQSYPFAFDYWNAWGNDVHTPAVYWSSESQTLGPVAPAPVSEPERLEVTQGQPVSHVLAGFQEDDAVKLTFSSDGLVTTYPRWDYDWSGTLFAPAWTGGGQIPGGGTQTPGGGTQTPGGGTQTPGGQRPPGGGVPQIPTGAGGGWSGGMGSNPAAPAAEGTSLILKPDDGVTQTTSGNKVTVRLDEGKIAALLKDQPKLQILELQVEDGKQLTLQLTGAIAEQMQEREVLLRVVGNGGVLTIPLHKINRGQEVQVEILADSDVFPPPQGFTRPGSSWQLRVRDGQAKLSVAAELRLPSGVSGAQLYRYDEEERRWVPVFAEVRQEKLHFNMLPNTVYSILKPGRTFSDIQSHWAKHEIELLAGRGILNGTGPSSFDPDQHVNRAEFAAMLLRILMKGEKQQEDLPVAFQDVKPSDWFFEEIRFGYVKKLVDGVEAERFAPNEPMTREQMFVIAARVYDASRKGQGLSEQEASGLLSPLRDRERISSWASMGIARALQLKLAQGKADQMIEPAAGGTRAEAAVITERLLRKLESP